MLIATIKKEIEVFISTDERKGQVEEFQVDFKTLNDLERYLAYHRSYIREISFSGTIKVKD